MRKTTNGGVCGFLAGLAMMTLATTGARADFMTYAFEGVVDEVVDWSHVITQYVQPGDMLSGTVTIDRSVPDSATDWDYAGVYDGAVVAVDGQVGDLTFTLDTPATSTVQILNDAPPLDWSYPGPWDEYAQGADVELIEVGLVFIFGFTLLDYSGTAFPESMGDAVPPFMPALDAFQENPDLGSNHHPPPFDIWGGGGHISGKLTSVGTVPEPGVSSLLLVGGALLTLRRSRAR